MPSTTNFSWTTPTVGGDTGAWGTILNTLFQAIDTDLFAVKGTADAAMPKAGGVFTDEIEVHTNKNALANPSISSGTLTLDLGTAQFFHFTVSEAVTTLTLSNVPGSGKAVFITMEITNGGAFAITWPSSFKWPGGSAPSLTASGVDVVMAYTRDGGTTWRAALAQEDSQ